MTDVLPRGRFNYALVRNAHRVTGAVDPLTGHLSFPRSNKRILCCFSVLWFLIAPLLRVGLPSPLRIVPGRPIPTGYGAPRRARLADSGLDRDLPTAGRPGWQRPCDPASTDFREHVYRTELN